MIILLHFEILNSIQNYKNKKYIFLKTQTEFGSS